LRLAPYVVLLSCGLLLMSTYIVRTLLPYITVDVGGREVDVSRVLYISFVVLAFISPIAGWLCDVYGSWRVLLISVIPIALIIPVYLYVDNVISLLVVIFIHALLGSSALAAALSIASWVTSRGGVGVGFLRFSQGLGIALGPIVASLLASVSYPPAFMLASILALTPLTALSIKHIGRSGVLSPLTSLKYSIKLLRLRGVRVLLSLAIAEALSFATLITYYTSYLVIHLKFNEVDYGLFLFLEAIAFSIGSYASERLYKAYSTMVAMIGCFALLISYTCLHFVYEKLPIFLLSSAIGLSSSLTFNPVYIEVSKVLSDEFRGLGINILDMIIDITLALIILLEPIVILIGFNNVTLIPVVIVLIALTTSMII